jgi:hypothetical protein
MPSRKQRRRQQKARRHEYEYVYVDEEGREVEVGDEELPPARASKGQARTRNGSRGGGRTIREVPPPSWRRTLRRAMLFAPFLLIVIWLTSKNTAPAARLSIAVVYSALLIPFLYFADTLAYRAYRRRLERDAARR